MSKKSASIIGPVTRSAGGNAMFNNNDIQFFNRFVKEDFTDIPEDKATGFKKFMEAENEKKKRQAKLEVVKESQQPVVLQAPNKYGKFNNAAKASISGDAVSAALRGEYAPGPSTEGTPSETKTIERVRKVYIDSADRNKVEYPDISDFQIFLGNTFENVIRVKLIDMQFPNVDSAINPSNNMIYWVNQEDMELANGQTFFNYDVTVKTGSYNTNSLVNQMSSALNNVNIKRRAGTGKAHYFIVNINRETDLVQFTSIIATPADSNPIYTTNGSGFIRVKQTNHGYENEPGKKTIIHIIGVRGNVGGIPSAELNGAFSITKIDNNYFSFEIATAATSTVAGGGGSFVKTGKEAPFQFLFGQYPNTIADALGFPVENSSVNVDQADPLTSMIRPLTTPDPTNLNAAVEEGEPTIIWCADHGLVPGDKIYLYNFFVQPSIYEDDKHKGIFEVHEVLSDDRFSIDWYTTRVSDVSRAYIGTQILHMYWENHGFNEISDISEVPAGSGIIQVTTKWPHPYKTNEGVLLHGTNSEPSLDGFHGNITVVSDDTFTFTWYETPDDPVNSALLHLTVPGNKGILTSDHNFYLYNVQPFGGFLATDLNNSPFRMRKIIDQDNFIFSTNYGFSSKAEQGGGSGVRINSKIHGWRGTQDNTVRDVVYKPVNLSGANYCYLCTPNVPNESVISTGQVKNIFAKLYLPLPPMNYIFDEFDSTPIEFEKPVPRLDMMRFAVRSAKNNPLEFAGLDYSFSLEITELVQVDDKNNVSSKMA